MAPSSSSAPPRPLRVAAAVCVAAAVALLIASIFGGLITAAQDQAVGTARPDVWHLLRMTSVQAALSTVLSLCVGTALAWALNRQHFAGRALLVGLFSSAIVTPGLVVAFGLLAVWGRTGWIASAQTALFGSAVDIPVFGLGGILAAHVILDGAFAARILLARLDSLPLERLKMGQSLGLDPLRRFTVIDWPAIASTLPGLAAIIFLLAFTSFPVVLLLGGGPANQTLEVAIYAAVRLDFDLPTAVQLSLMQVAACAAVVLAVSLARSVPLALSVSRPSRWREPGPVGVLQWTIIALCTFGFALPLAAVLSGLWPGLAGLLTRSAFWAALGTSIGIGTASALLALFLALALGLGRAATASRALRLTLGLPTYTYLAVPSMVLALGLFLLVRNTGTAPVLAAKPVIVLANALLALPFATAALAPVLDAITQTHGRLVRSLGLSGAQQFARVEWPLLGHHIGVVLALGFCFSLGDLGVIALFGTQDFATLPLLMVRALGAYRSTDAAAIAGLMLLMAVAVFALLPPLIERLSRAAA